VVHIFAVGLEFGHLQAETAFEPNWVATSVLFLTAGFSLREEPTVNHKPTQTD
jgi:hypothetical protein